MSRIGNAIIELPQGVDFSIDGNIVTVKGPKGELKQEIHESITPKIEDGVVSFDRANELKQTKAYHGLYRSLVKNMVIGVTEGYKTEQELVGVGYRASNKGQLLELSLGYSHPIHFQIPEEVKVTTVSEKGQNPMVILESHDKQLIGAVAAKIRSLRKPEPYKGKGIRFKGEYIRRKAGKTAAA
ncbi:MAG: 50S ribosomal protein L6 [Bacteroidota bacterium]